MSSKQWDIAYGIGMMVGIAMILFVPGGLFDPFGLRHIQADEVLIEYRLPGDPNVKAYCTPADVCRTMGHKWLYGKLSPMPKTETWYIYIYGDEDQYVNDRDFPFRKCIVCGMRQSNVISDWEEEK